MTSRAANDKSAEPLGTPRDVVRIAGDDNGMRHVLFARLCLGWSWLEALHVRISFGRVPLSEETMHKMLEAAS